MSALPAGAFDFFANWKRLADHLDTFNLIEVCDRVVLDVRDAGPAQCPRHECRSVRVWSSEGNWLCHLCGAMGRGAALFAARSRGWLHDQLIDHEPADVERDFEHLAREALFSGFFDHESFEWPDWIEWFESLPNFEKWSTGQRGIFEGEDRPKALVRYARAMFVSNVFDATGIERSCWAWNTAYCRPPLTRLEMGLGLVEAVRRT